MLLLTWLERDTIHHDNQEAVDTGVFGWTALWIGVCLGSRMDGKQIGQLQWFVLL